MNAREIESRASGPVAGAIMAGDQIAGFLEATGGGWCFRAASRRFAALDDARFARSEDALCAARGVVALEGSGCRCRAGVCERDRDVA